MGEILSSLSTGEWTVGCLGVMQYAPSERMLCLHRRLPEQTSVSGIDDQAVQIGRVITCIAQPRLDIPGRTQVAVLAEPHWLGSARLRADAETKEVTLRAAGLSGRSWLGELLVNQADCVVGRETPIWFRTRLVDACSLIGTTARCDDIALGAQQDGGVFLKDRDALPARLKTHDGSAVWQRVDQIERVVGGATAVLRVAFTQRQECRLDLLISTARCARRCCGGSVGMQHKWRAGIRSTGDRRNVGQQADCSQLGAQGACQWVGTHGDRLTRNEQAS